MSQTPEEYGDDATLLGTEMVQGVEFAHYERPSGTEFYVLVYPDGTVEDEPLAEVFPDGNYTKGRLESTGRRVMIDDFGVHHNW